MTATYGEHPGPLPDHRPSALDRLEAVGATRPAIPCPTCSPAMNRLADEASRLRAELDRVTAEKAAAVVALDDSLDFPGGIA